MQFGQLHKADIYSLTPAFHNKLSLYGKTAGPDFGLIYVTLNILLRTVKNPEPSIYITLFLCL